MVDIETLTVWNSLIIENLETMAWFSFLFLLLVRWQSSVLYYWFGCFGYNRKRRSSRECLTCWKLPHSATKRTKGKTSTYRRCEVNPVSLTLSLTLYRKINKCYIMLLSHCCCWSKIQLPVQPASGYGMGTGSPTILYFPSSCKMTWWYWSQCHFVQQWTDH